MIRKTIFAAIALLLAVPVFAGTGSEQDSQPAVRERYKSGPAENNWFVSVGGGAQMYFGDHDTRLTFKEWVSPAVDVAAGKWFLPWLGARVMYSGFAIRGAAQNGVHSQGTPISGKPWDGYWLENSRFGYFHLHGDVMFNFCNIIWGYKQDRVYSCSPYVGVGLMYVYEDPKVTTPALTGGIFNSFRISPSIDINLDLRANLVSDRFDGETGGRSGEGLVVVSAGITYKFRERGW